MASLTGTLDSIGRGQPQAQPKQYAPSPLGMIAGAATSLFDGLDDKAIRAYRADTQARAARTEEKANLKTAAENATAQAWYDEMSRATADLAKTKAAVDQGRAPSGRLDIHLDAVVGQLFNKFPENKNDIVDYMHAKGWDNWQFREVKAAAAAQEAQQTAEVAAGTADYKYAFDQGLGNPDKSFEHNRDLGMLLRYQDKRLEEIRALAEAQQKAAAEGRAEETFNQGQLDRDAVGVINARIQTQMNEWMPVLHSLVGGAVGDSEKEKKLSELAPLMLNKVETDRQNALSQLGTAATKDTISQVNQEYDRAKKMLEDQFSGTLTSYNQTRQAVEHIGNLAKVNAATSMRTYTDLSTVFGRETVNSWFAAGQPPFKPEIMKQVTAEIQGYQTPDASRGRAHLAKLSAILKGQLGLKDLTEEEAIAQMPAMATTVANLQGAILTNGENLDHTTVSNWSNAYTVLLDAASEVQPGQRNLSSLSKGTQLIASRGARTVLARLIASPDYAEQGKAMAIASRGSAATALTVAKGADYTTTDKPFMKIEFTGSGYRAVFDRQGWERWRGSSTRQMEMGGGRLYQSYKDAATPSKATQDKLNILNLSLTHLVHTAQYDESVPKGVTSEQLYKHYALGTPFAKVNGKPMLTSDEQFTQEVDKFRTQLQKDGTKVEPVNISDIRFSSPVDALVRTVIGEDPKNATRIASVVLNRAGGDINKVPDVVLANDGKTWQFEPWGNNETRARLLSISPTSKEYLRVMQMIAPLLTGDTKRDPYTHFYAPKAQATLGREKPSWDNGTGVDFGDTRFFTLR